MKIRVVAILLIVIFVVFQSCSAEPLEGINQTRNIWNGTWADDTYTLYFHQNGTEISGIYEPFDYDTPYDIGRLEGTLSPDEKQFSGKWIVKGIVSVHLSDDENSFTGTSVDNPINGLIGIKAKELYANRTGIIQDAQNPWTGTWKTATKTFNLTQTGSEIKGETHPLPGVADGSQTLEGIISKDKKIAIINSTKAGDVILIISNDGSYYNGTYMDDFSGSDEQFSRNMTRIG